MIEITYMEIREKIFCDYGFRETVDVVTDNYDKECNSPAHRDLIVAVKELAPHIAVMIGQEQILLKWDAKEITDGIRVIGVDFGNGNWCKIKAEIKLPDLGYWFIANIPKIDYAIDKPGYKFMEKFKKQITKVQDRVLEYHNGCYGDGEQLALEFGSPDQQRKVELSRSTVDKEGGITDISVHGKNKGKAGKNREKGGEQPGSDEENFSDPGL